MDVTLEIKKGSKKTRQVRLTSDEVIVGRREGSDLRIPSAEVSRKHCRLTFQDEFLRVEDLDSSNGTFVNGERVTQLHTVKPGDVLRVGPIVFLVKYRLSEAAIDRMLKEEGTDDQDLEEGAIELTDDALIEDDDEAIEIGEDNLTLPADDDEEAEEAEVLEDDWEAPEGGDIRDILSQLED